MLEADDRQLAELTLREELEMEAESKWPDGPPMVYKAIAQVTGKLAKEGIAKSRKNQSQGYQFRGIDDVYNALAPFLAEAHLCILPRVISREVVERQTKDGKGVLFYVTVQVEFWFVSADDGSSHVVKTYGEAMDSGDKATNKAMSAAYKYAAMQAFCIPTEGDNDADAHTHEVGAIRLDTALVARYEAVESMEDLAALWNETADKPSYAAIKDQAKRRIAAAPKRHLAEQA